MNTEVPQLSAEMTTQAKGLFDRYVNDFFVGYEFVPVFFYNTDTTDPTNFEPILIPDTEDVISFINSFCVQGPIKSNPNSNNYKRLTVSFSQAYNPNPLAKINWQILFNSGSYRNDSHWKNRLLFRHSDVTKQALINLKTGNVTLCWNHGKVIDDENEQQAIVQQFIDQANLFLTGTVTPNKITFWNADRVEYERISRGVDHPQIQDAENSLDPFRTFVNNSDMFDDFPPLASK